MKLILQPQDGIKAVIEALDSAERSIQIAIFRCDHMAVERALVAAVRRGVAVHALIAANNRGGEPGLRGLETRLLAAGAVVARTNNDLPRYHGKYILIDERELYLLAFNFTRSDTSGTRSFGISTSEKHLVADVASLFRADSTRQPFEPSGKSSVLVSPVNARAGLVEFLEAAEDELLIYDLDVSDREMKAILEKRAKDGVKIRVIGSVKDPGGWVEVRSPNPLRLHARTIVRDGKAFFLGSQSLRRLELDMRREVGIVVDDKSMASKVASIFEEDWSTATEGKVRAAKVAKRVAKAVSKEMGPISGLIEQAAAKAGVKMDSAQMEEAVQDAVKAAVREAVQEVISNSAS